MRNAIIGWSVLGALLGSGTVSAQHEEALAKAYQLEEVEGRVAEALAGYESVAAATKLPERPCFDALLGKARCLRRLARFDEAAAVVAELEAAKFPWAIGNTVKLERERLERARAEQDEERKKLREEISRLLFLNDEAGVLSLGARAIPVLLELARVGSKEQILPIPAQALLMLYRQRDPAAIAAVLELVRQRQSPISANPMGLALPRPDKLAQDWDPVIRAYVESPDADVRYCGVMSFVSLRGAAPDLVRRALGDEDARVRQQLLNWLGGAPLWVGQELGTEVLRTLAVDPQIAIRKTVLGSLTGHAARNRQVQREIAEILTHDEVEEIREGAFRMLGRQLGERERREQLQRGLADSSLSIRVLCAELHRHLITAQDVAILMPLLQVSDGHMRKRVAEVLAGREISMLLERPEHVEILRRTLEDPVEWPRFLAARTLATNANRETVSMLLPSLSDASGDVRRVALEAILRLDAIDAFPAIQSALDSLKSIPEPKHHPDYTGNWSSWSRHGDVVRWLLERGHSMELDQMLSRIEDLDLRDEDIEFLSGSLSSDRKRGIFERIAALEDPSRRAELLLDLHALGRGEPEYLSQCIELVRRYPDVKRVGTLRYTVCRLGGPEHADVVFEYLDAGFEGDASIARFFARCLEDAKRSRFEEFLRAKIVGQVARWAQYATPEVLSAANILYLEALAQHVPEGHSTASIFDAAARIQDPRALALFISCLGSATHARADDPRFRVIERMVREGGDTAVELISRALRDPQAKSVVEWHGALADGTRSESTITLSAHVWILFLARRERFLELARGILDTEGHDELSRSSAVVLCGFLPAGAGDAILREGLEDASAPVRAAAVRAVAHLLMESSIPRIRELLRDPEVSREANQALLRFAAFGYPIR